MIEWVKRCLVLSSFAWLCLKLFSCFLKAFGCVRRCLVMPEGAWLCQKVFGSVWFCLKVFRFVLLCLKVFVCV